MTCYKAQWRASRSLHGRGSNPRTEPNNKPCRRLSTIIPPKPCKRRRCLTHGYAAGLLNLWALLVLPMPVRNLQNPRLLQWQTGCTIWLRTDFAANESKMHVEEVDWEALQRACSSRPEEHSTAGRWTKGERNVNLLYTCINEKKNNFKKKKKQKKRKAFSWSHVEEKTFKALSAKTGCIFHCVSIMLKSLLNLPVGQKE